MGVLGTGSFTFVAIISHSFNGVRVGDEIRCGHKRTTLCYVFSASVYVAFDYRPSFAFLHTSYTKVARDFLPCFVFKEVTKGGGGVLLHASTRVFPLLSISASAVLIRVFCSTERRVCNSRFLFLFANLQLFYPTFLPLDAKPSLSVSLSLLLLAQ